MPSGANPGEHRRRTFPGGGEALYHIPYRRVIPPPTAWRWHLPLVQLARHTGERQALAPQLGDDGLELHCPLEAVAPLVRAEVYLSVLGVWLSPAASAIDVPQTLIFRNPKYQPCALRFA